MRAGLHYSTSTLPTILYLILVVGGIVSVEKSSAARSLE